MAGATTVPRALRAQQKATLVIGILAPNPKVFATLTLERDLAARVTALETDPKDALARALARLGRAFMARDS